MAVQMKTTKSTTSEAAPRGRRVEVVGEVVSDKMDKTISVLIFRLVRHKKYGKYMKRTSVFKAHDEKNQAKIGDVVKIHETRPMSKTKRWALSEIVENAKA
jgi:small subunit ribosomal protein S17